MESKEEKHVCGWRWLMPAWLQRFNTPVCYLIFMCLGNCFQSMTVNGLVGVVLSTIERRFDLTSLQSSWISSAYEVGTLPALIVVSFVGIRAHRPRWVALSLALLGLGSFMFAFPYFTSGVYQADSDIVTDNVCRNRTGEEVCKLERTTDLTNYLAIFLIARFVHSFGATPLYTMGVTMMDDGVPKDKFALYLGAFYACGVLGPAVGVFAGGFFLSLHTDWTTMDTEVEYTNTDPRWVGAWWLGFLISGTACALLAVPFSCFPRDFPGADDIRKAKKSEAHNATDDVAAENTVDFSKISDFPYHCKVLITNPTYVLQTLFICCDAVIISGFSAYGAKYMETQFSTSSTMAGILFGVTLLPAGAGGTILGGIIIERLKLTCKKIIRAQIILSILVILTSGCFWFQCQGVELMGVTTPYTSNISTSISLSDTCNADCSCEDIPYNHLCSHDNVRFYSPCHAGCTKMVDRADFKEYYECSCISAPPNVTAPGSSQECTPGSCTVAPFLVFFFCSVLAMFICNSMSATATIRCIRVKERSLGIGAQWIVIRLIGTIPGPILFGLAFDNSCLYWPERCGKKTSCMYYDIPKTALTIFIMCACLKVLSLIFIILAYKIYKPPPGDLDNIDKTENTAKTISDGHFKQTKEESDNASKVVLNGAVTYPQNSDQIKDSALSQDLVNTDYTYL